MKTKAKVKRPPDAHYWLGEGEVARKLQRAFPMPRGPLQEEQEPDVVELMEHKYLSEPDTETSE
jgi:hypothetical protein